MTDRRIQVITAKLMELHQEMTDLLDEDVLDEPQATRFDGAAHNVWNAIDTLLGL